MSDEMIGPLEAAQLALEVCFDHNMRSAFVVAQWSGETEAATKEEFFGFTCGDVADVYSHKQGHGFGTFFRLKDGRIFDHRAQPSDSDVTLYDATTH
jgi:hypothetical protein